MKVGPRNAMVIAVVSLALAAGEELRASFGSAGPRPLLVTAPREEAAGFPERVAAAASPIDDVRGSAAYRRHAAAVLAARALDADARRMRIALRRQRRPGRGRLLGGRIAALRAARALGYPGSKNACEQGECGSCSVLLDGHLVCACLVLAAQADGHEVTTIEGLAAGRRSSTRCRRRSSRTGAVQCGFCTPGLVVAAADLLARAPDPSDDEIREALSGNLCRCTGYEKIFAARPARRAGGDERPARPVAPRPLRSARDRR